jgi:hypothetical protein
MAGMEFSSDSTRLFGLVQSEGLLEVYVWTMDDQTLQLNLDFEFDFLDAAIFNERFRISRNETSIVIEGWEASRSRRRFWELDYMTGNFIPLSEDGIVARPLLTSYGQHLFNGFEKIFRLPLLYKDYGWLFWAGNHVVLGYEDGRVIIMDFSPLIQGGMNLHSQSV